MALKINLSLDAVIEKSYLLFIFGFVYSFLSIFFGIWFFPQNPALFTFSIIMISLVPVFYSISKRQERILVEDYDYNFFKEHMTAIKSFLFIFFGVTLAFFIVAFFIPESSFELFFSDQIETLSVINPKLTGNFYVNLNRFVGILFNNLSVLIFSLLFSVIFGVGALFVLIWNSSVLGVAMSSFFHLKLTEFFSSSQIVVFVDYIKAFFLTLLRFSLHGIPEIASYFIAGLAGSIIFFAIINNHFTSKRFEDIVFDISNLVLFSLIVLLSAAFLEVFVTPLFFA